MSDNDLITRYCSGCGKPVLRFKIVRNEKKDCAIVNLELKCKTEQCKTDNPLQIQV